MIHAALEVIASATSGIREADIAVLLRVLKQIQSNLAAVEPGG